MSTNRRLVKQLLYRLITGATMKKNMIHGMNSKIHYRGENKEGVVCYYSSKGRK